jgi:hypothetical protein
MCISSGAANDRLTFSLSAGPRARDTCAGPSHMRSSRGPAFFSGRNDGYEMHILTQVNVPGAAA